MEKINEAGTLIARVIKDLKDLDQELSGSYAKVYDMITTLEIVLEILL